MMMTRAEKMKRFNEAVAHRKKQREIEEHFLGFENEWDESIDQSTLDFIYKMRISDHEIDCIFQIMRDSINEYKKNDSKEK